MKTAKRIILSSVSVVLAAMMCLSLLPVTALAAETKRNPSGAPDGTHSYVAISDESAKAPGSEYSDGFRYAYTDKHGAKSLFSGAITYDLKSNTLTLKNLSQKSRFMEICNMGSDFRIKVTGTNTVASISLFGYEGDCSVTFTGDGTLNVTDYGIDLYGSNRDAVMTIGKDVTINASYDGGAAPAIRVNGSTASKPLILKAKEKQGGKAGRTSMKKAEIPWHYDLNSKSQYLVFYNPSKPYSQYSQFAETVYFGINEPVKAKWKRTTDNLEHDCLQFTIMALEEDGSGSFIIKATLIQKYIWDDDPLYASLIDDYRNVTYDMVDPSYELVDTTHLTDEWSIVNSQNVGLSNVKIIPSDGTVELLPQIMTATLPNGITGRNYSAQLEAEPANGGTVTSYKLTGNASEWLSVDNSGLLTGKPPRAGHFNLTVTATETAGGKTYESAPVTLGITVNEPNNKVKIETKVSDTYFHKLVARKKSDSSVVKTLNLESRAISAGTVYYLGSLPAGEYEVEFCGEVTGGTVTYSNAKADLTVEENSINSIGVSPESPTFAPNDTSVMVRLKNEEFYSRDFFVEFSLSNGKTNNRVLNENAENNIFPDMLENGVTVQGVRLYLYDMYNNRIDVLKGEPAVDGNTYTLDVDTNAFTEYTVSGIPDEVRSVILTDGEGYAYVEDGGKYISKPFTDETAPAIHDISFVGYNTDKFYSSKPVMKTEGNKIRFEFEPLVKDALLSGKVEDKDGNPVSGAGVTISQDMSYLSSSFTTVTDRNGVYKAEGLYSGVPVAVCVSSEGYKNAYKNIASLKKSDTADFTLEKQNAITLIISDGDIHNASIEWDGYGKSSVSGNRFTLEIPSYATEKEYTVSVTADDIVGTASGKVSVRNGFGTLELTPVRKGTISWYEPDEEQNPVNDYRGYYVSVNGNNYLAGQINSAELNPGTYTVQLKKNIFDTKPVISQDLTVKSGETVYLTEKLPGDAETEKTGTADFTAPGKAMTNEQYRVSGVISTIDNKYITALTLQSFTQRGSSDSIKYVTVNGTRVAVENNIILRKNNKQADWSLPLNLTLYCKQNATKSNPTQTVSVFVNTSGNPEDMSTDDPSGAAAVTTRYSPSITLDIAEEIGGSVQKDENGNKYYTPNPVNFYGRAAKNAEVRLYDNGILCAVTKANGSGIYNGNFTFADDSVLHEIRAEAQIEGETASVSTSCSYVPENATLKDIYMGFSDSWTSAERVPLRGESSYSYRTNDNRFVFFSRFDNDDRLDDLTCTTDGKETTAKVFFRIKTTCGKSYTLPAEKDDRGYKTKPLSLVNEFPSGIKVLYLSKDTSNHSTKITFDGEEYEVSQALKRINVDSPEDGSYISNSDYVLWFKNLYKEYLKEQNSDKDKISTGAPESGWTEEPDLGDKEPQEISTDEAHEVMVWMMNKGDGAGTFNNITAEQAAEKAPADKYKLRTYTDSQPWTYTKQNFKLRQQEFQYKGYVCTNYTDESTGHTMFMFTGTFYYDRYAMPVPSLTVEKVYSGIKKTEDDPRMFQKSSEDKGGDAKGKMLGSQLDVTYCFDSVTKQWIRLQTATISPGAKSPIHTAASQIPCKTDAPYSYTPANVHMITPTGADAKSKAPTGADAKTATGDGNKWSGIDFGIDVTKVSAKTWVSGAISVGGAAYGKFANNTYIGPNCKVPANAPFNKYKHNWKTNPLALDSLDVVEESLQHYAGGSKSIYQIGLTKEGIGGAAATFTLNKINDATHKSGGSANDGLDYLEKQLRDNMRYWGNVKSVAQSTADGSNGGIIGNFELDKYAADKMIQKTRDVADKLTAIQKAVEDAQTQDSFTKNCTDALGYASLVTSLIPSYGTACALTFDSVSFLLSAANDTRNAKVQQAVKEFLQEYAEYLEMDEEEKRKLKEDDELVKSHQNMGANVKTRKQVAAAAGGGLVDPMGGDDAAPAGGSDVSMTPVHDPSGIVYEAVLSNPVEGAEVTLYNYESVENPMNLWDDSAYLNQDNPITSDSNGCYRWDVPEGEWYVIAKKDGYEPGSSNNDAEATVRHGDYNYLPVMPPQLNVNIPLVSYAAPEVESAIAKTDGIYVTFSKYMDESTLNEGNFALTDFDGNNIKFTLEKLDSEQAPTNINYSGKAPSYTKTVRLAAKLSADDEVTLKVGETVSSYAGANIAVPYGEILTVTKKTAVKAPAFSVKSGKVEKNTVLNITAEDSATILYTTDGTAPTEQNGKKAVAKAEIVLVEPLTVKAIAVKTGCDASETAQAEYTISSPYDREEPVTPVEPSPTVKKPKLSKTSASLKAGKTLTLKVTNGKVKSWKSSKKSVVTVTKSGKLTALKKGSAKVTATLKDGKKLTCNVKVTTSPTIKIGKKKFSAKSTYKVKRKKTLTVSITGKASTVKNVYKTSSKKIAKITSKTTAKKLTIKAYKKGKATITLKVNGVSFKIKVRVI